MKELGQLKRREFLCAAGAGGAALMLSPGNAAHGQESLQGERLDPDQGWEWVDPDEVYDPSYEYRFVYDDSTPVGWEWIDMQEPYDPTYEYAYVELYEDGTRAEWVEADAEEPFDPDYEYLNEDDTPLAWEYTDGFELEDPSYRYDYEYDYVYPDGTPSDWEWVEPGDPFDGDYEYAYESVEDDMRSYSKN